MAASRFPEERFVTMPPKERHGTTMWTWGWATNNTSIPTPKMLFYSSMPDNASCVFSLNDQVKAPRVPELMRLGDRPAIAWDNAQIENEAQSLRARYPEEARKVARPGAWEDLYRYYDPYDLWFKGAWNLWCVIDLLGEQNNAHFSNTNTVPRTAVTNLIHGSTAASTTTSPTSLAARTIVADAAAFAQNQLKDHQSQDHDNERFQIIDHWVHSWLTKEENRKKISLWDHSTSILYSLWPEDYINIGHDLLAEEALRLQHALEYWHKAYYCASCIEPMNRGPPDPNYVVDVNTIRKWTSCRFEPRQNSVGHDSVDSLQPSAAEPRSRSVATSPAMPEVGLDDTPRPNSSSGISQHPSVDQAATNGTNQDTATKYFGTKQDEMTRAKVTKEATKKHHQASKSGPVIPIPIDPELANRRDGVEKLGPSRLPSRSSQLSAPGNSGDHDRVATVDNSSISQDPAASIVTQYFYPPAQRSVSHSKPTARQEPVQPQVPISRAQRVQVNVVEVPNVNVPTKSFSPPSRLQAQRASLFCENNFFFSPQGHPGQGPIKECVCTRCMQASRSVIVKNIDCPNNLTTNEKRGVIIDFFSQWGKVDRCDIKSTKTNSRIYAMVCYQVGACAETAIHAAQGLPLLPLSTNISTWYPYFHKNWRKEPPKSSLGQLNLSQQAGLRQNGSPGYRQRTSPPSARRPQPTVQQQSMVHSLGHISPPKASPMSQRIAGMNGPRKLSPESYRPGNGHGHHPGMARPHPIDFATPQSNLYSDQVTIDHHQGYGALPPHPDAFLWQCPQYSAQLPNGYPTSMSAPMPTYSQNSHPIPSEVLASHVGDWPSPLQQLQVANFPTPESAETLQSKVPLDEQSCGHRGSINSTSSNNSSVRVRLPSMSPEKTVPSGRQSPTMSKESSTPDSQGLKSLDPSILAEGKIVATDMHFELPPTSRFGQGDIRLEPGYSGTVVHRPAAKQQHYRRLPSDWMPPGSNSSQRQPGMQEETAAKKSKNKRNKSSGSRPSTPVNSEEKIETAKQQNCRQVPANKGYRADAGGSLKMTRNRRNLVIDTRSSQEFLSLPATSNAAQAGEKSSKKENILHGNFRDLPKRFDPFPGAEVKPSERPTPAIAVSPPEIKPQSNASLTIEGQLQHRVSESSILTTHSHRSSYHSAKSMLLSPNSCPDSADGQKFVSAPQTPVETDGYTSSATLSGNPSPALTAIPADRSRLTPKASQESNKADDWPLNPTVGPKDNAEESASKEVIGDRSSEKGSEYSKVEGKKPTSQPSNEGKSEIPKPKNRNKTKEMNSQPLKETEEKQPGSGSKVNETKPYSSSKPALKTEEQAKPIEPAQSSTKVEPAKPQTSTDAEPTVKADKKQSDTLTDNQFTANAEKQPRASTDPQPRNKAKRKKAKKVNQSTNDSEGKDASLHNKKTDNTSKNMDGTPDKVDDKPGKAENNSNKSSTSAQATGNLEQKLAQLSSSTTTQSSPKKKNKKAIKRENALKRKIHEASVAAVPGAA